MTRSAPKTDAQGRWDPSDQAVRGIDSLRWRKNARNVRNICLELLEISPGVCYNSPKDKPIHNGKKFSTERNRYHDLYCGSTAYVSGGQALTTARLPSLRREVGAGQGNLRYLRLYPRCRWCAPQQGACKLTLNIKNGIIEEALVETIGCSGMTHSAAMPPRSSSARPFWRR